MRPQEERVLKIALDAYDDDTAEVAVAVLQDELIEQWDRAPYRMVNFHQILRLVPWSMPFKYQWSTDGERAVRPSDADVFEKRRWMARTIAAYLLFRDWPHRWPLAERCGAADVAR